MSSSDTYHHSAMRDHDSDQHSATSWSQMDWSRRPPDAYKELAVHHDSQHTVTSWSKMDLSQHVQQEMANNRQRSNGASPQQPLPLATLRSNNNAADDSTVDSFEGDTVVDTVVSESHSQHMKFPRRASTGSSSTSERRFPRRASMESGLQSISESHDSNFGNVPTAAAVTSLGGSNSGHNGIPRHVDAAYRSSLDSKSVGSGSASLARYTGSSRRSSLESLGSTSSIPRNVNAIRDPVMRGSVDSMGSWSTFSNTELMWNPES